MLLIVQVRSANYLDAQVQSIVQYIVQYSLQNSVQCTVQRSVQYMYVVMFYLLPKSALTNRNRPAEGIYLGNWQSFSGTNVFCTLYNTVYNAVYSTLFSTVQTVALGSYYRVQEGGIPVTGTHMYSLLYSTVYGTVYSTVYSTVYKTVYSAMYNLVFSTVQVCSVSRSLQERDIRDRERDRDQSMLLEIYQYDSNVAILGPVYL